jgi:hypothetical protein
MVEVTDLAAYRVETGRLVEKHLDHLGFGPADMDRRHQQAEDAQRTRWGKTGLDLLNIAEDAEEIAHRGEWSGAEVDDVLALIEAL